MKHTIELKMPKIFAKKKVEEPVVTTEVDVDEAKSKVNEVLKVAAPIAATLVVGYVAGYNRGITNGLKAAGNVFIFDKK